MKIPKKLLTLSLTILCFMFIVPNLFPEIQTTISANATTLKLNKTKATLSKGEKLRLKVTGTKSKVRWSSSNKKVATVSSTGRVTAKKNGTAKITAKVKNKKLTCKITVKYKDTGKGTMYVATPSGTSENGKIPKLYISENTFLVQISLNMFEFNYTPKTYIYIDGKLEDTEHVSDMTTTLTLCENSLKRGMHTVEVVQYKNNNPKSKVITYKKAQYKVIID